MEEHQEAGRGAGFLADLTLPASGSPRALEVHLQLGAQVLRRVRAPGPFDQQGEGAERSHAQLRSPAPGAQATPAECDKLALLSFSFIS